MNVVVSYLIVVPILMAAIGCFVSIYTVRKERARASSRADQAFPNRP